MKSPGNKLMFQCVQQCKNRLKSDLISVILFGSAATSMKTAQDYDLLVVTKKTPAKEWLLAGEIKASLMSSLDKPVDLIFMEEEELNYPSPLIYEICEKHKLLYGKNVLPPVKKMRKLIQPLFERGVKVGWKVAQ